MNSVKKFAIRAGVAAAMATGSMSAGAVITSVPAPAQLVPLFYYSSANAIDTEVRVVVPRTVGADTVINLLSGSVAPITSISGSWNATNAALTSSATAKIHWFFMNVNSAEITNASFPVTADDEVYFTASAMPCQVGSGTGSSCGSTGTAAPQLTSGQVGYLILTNESAAQGGAPSFVFTADAWLTNEATNIGGSTNGLSSNYYIPVLGLADAADTTTYPTPVNNVIEAYPTSAGGPIASPLHTGFRANSTVTGANYRVVDVPIFPLGTSTTPTYGNMVVVWTDENDTYQGKAYTVNNAELQVSNGTFSFPNQLNAAFVGATGTVPPTAFSDLYTGATGASLSPTVGNLASGGFLKMVFDAPALPATGLSAGAYNSFIAFTLPVIGSSSGVPTTFEDDSTEVAIDTGFFSSN